MTAAKMIRRFLLRRTVILGCLVLSACSLKNDNAHTTATTYVDPPRRQVLTVIPQPSLKAANNFPPQKLDSAVDTTKPLLIFMLENGRTFRVGDEVPVAFSVENAKLKGDGGEFRVRYIIDDGEMLWLDDSTPVAIRGWVVGKHTIRLELIGPDGWPYKNGNANIVTREITVIKQQ